MISVFQGPLCPVIGPPLVATNDAEGQGISPILPLVGGVWMELGLAWVRGPLFTLEILATVLNLLHFPSPPPSSVVG